MAERKSTDDEKTTSSTATGGDDSAASAAREVAQDQPDRVAMVSRTSTGDAAQSPGYEVIGLPEKPTEAQRAAAENRPDKGKG